MSGVMCLVVQKNAFILICPMKEIIAMKRWCGSKLRKISEIEALGVEIEKLLSSFITKKMVESIG